MQIGKVHIGELQDKVIGLELELKRISLLLDWIREGNPRIRWPSDLETEVLDQIAAREIQDRYGDSVQFFGGEGRNQENNPIEALKQNWENLEREILKVGMRDNVALSVTSGPLNEVIVLNGKLLQQPFQRMIERLAESLGYWTTFK